jgi:hypothetical protein
VPLPFARKLQRVGQVQHPVPRPARCPRARQAHEAHAAYLLNRTHELCPPKPKELDRATSTSTCTCLQGE